MGDTVRRDHRSEEEWITVSGAVVRGHEVASGAGRGSPYPAGTIALQLPHFLRLGLDISRYHPATINVSIAPRRLRLARPRYRFRQVEWTSLHPPEDFSFSPCRVEYRGALREGLVYQPHPETKARHFQEPSTVEVIAEYVPGIEYGSTVLLHLRRDEADVI